MALLFRKVEEEKGDAPPPPVPTMVYGQNGALVASAVNIPLNDRKMIERYRRRMTEWQDDAWRYYDEIGEIWFAHQFIGNAIRKIRLYAGEITADDAPPSPIEDPEHPAVLNLDRLRGGSVGFGHLLAPIAIHLAVAGESWVVGQRLPDGREEWKAYSSDQLQARDGKFIIMSSPSDREGEPLNELTDVLIRIWRPHPRWDDLPDSAMRAVLDHCEELQILSRMIRATARSRVGANGILFLPAEPEKVAVDPTLDESGGNVELTDPFVADMINAMLVPIQDEGSAASVIPLISRMDADLIDHIKWVSIERHIDTTAAAQRTELIGRIAGGLDLPADVLKGVSQANHWSAWLVDEQTFKAHIEPMILIIVAALTGQFLRPALGAQATDSVIWYDASNVVAHPNRAADAKEAHKTGALSDGALRRYTNFPDSDAPSPTEIVFRMAYEGKLSPQLTLEVLKLQGYLPESLEVDQTTPGPFGGGGAPEITPDVGPPQPQGAGVRAITAASTVQTLGERLRRIDDALFQQLSTAADAAVFRALERAGAKLRRRVGNDGALKAKLASVEQHLVASTLGPAIVRHRFQLEDDELIDEEFGPLRAKYEASVLQAQRRSNRLIDQYSDNFDESDVEAQQTVDREAGWVLLAAAARRVAQVRLFDPDGPVLQGESDAALAVEPGAIRRAMARAGGASGQASMGGAVVGADGGVAGGVATGQLVTDLFYEAGLVQTSYAWEYGQAANGFGPHQDLAGQEFSSFNDEVLMADASQWPYVSYYHPGDHPGCQCSFTPQFEFVNAEDAN